MPSTRHPGTCSSKIIAAASLPANGGRLCRRSFFSDLSDDAAWRELKWATTYFSRVKARMPVMPIEWQLLRSRNNNWSWNSWASRARNQSSTYRHRARYIALRLAQPTRVIQRWWEYAAGHSIPVCEPTIVIESIDIDGRLREIHRFELKVQIQRQRSFRFLESSDPLLATMHAESSVKFNRSSCGVDIRSLLEEIFFVESINEDDWKSESSKIDILVSSLIVPCDHISFEKARLNHPSFVDLNRIDQRTRFAGNHHVRLR